MCSGTNHKHDSGNFNSAVTVSINWMAISMVSDASLLSSKTSRKLQVNGWNVANDMVALDYCGFG